MRIDKYTWCVRLFKTRKLATETCSKEKVLLNGAICKPSKTVNNGDVVSVRELGIWKEFKVIELPKNRIGAKLVEQYMLEITPEEEKEKLAQIKEMNRENHLLGLKGRPTKKNRRDWEDFHD